MNIHSCVIRTVFKNQIGRQTSRHTAQIITALPNIRQHKSSLIFLNICGATCINFHFFVQKNNESLLSCRNKHIVCFVSFQFREFYNFPFRIKTVIANHYLFFCCICFYSTICTIIPFHTELTIIKIHIRQILICFHFAQRIHLQRVT